MGNGIFRIVLIRTAICFIAAAFATTAAATTRIWTGTGNDNNWTNAANWASGAPVAGDELVFPTGVLNTTTNNNFPAGTKFESMTFARPYTVNGNRILINSSIVHLGSDEVTVHTDITLEGGPNGYGIVTVHIANTDALIRINGAIGGSAPQNPAKLKKNGLGRLELFGANTYGGVTQIDEGEVRIHHATALGSTVGNTSVGHGGALAVDVPGNATVAEPLVLAGTGTGIGDSGAVVFRAPATLSGAITLSNVVEPRITVAFAGSADILGAIGGDNGFVKRGVGDLRLRGANTYTGITTVAEKKLVLLHAQALGSQSSGTTVQYGASVDIAVPEIANEPLLAQSNNSNVAVLACLEPAVCTWSGPIVFQGTNGFFASAGRTLRLTGNISGNGELLLDLGTGLIELLGTNTYGGNTTVRDVTLGGGHAIPDGSRVWVSSGTMNLDGGSETIAALTGSAQANVALGAGTLTIDMLNGISIFQGVISGSGGLVKKSVGTFEIRNVQAYTGTTTVQGGALKLDPTAKLPGAVNVTDGFLRGTGQIGALTANGGKIEPGPGTGILTTQALNMAAGSTLALELKGAIAGAQYDQVKVTTGPVVVNGATLELSVTFVDPPAAPLVIVKNDGAGAVTGQFAGLPEGAVASSANGRELRISYTGGDGNDIVLTGDAPTYYLSEGATGAFFDLDILIANPSSTTAAPVTLTFLRPDGSTVVIQVTVFAQKRVTVNVDDLAGLESTEVSTIVTSPSGLPLIVERTMRWDAKGYGAHTEKAVTSTSKDWYFAEGSQGFFSTYLLLANPQPSPNVATVRYLRENASAIVRTYQVAANSRFTVDAGSDPELVGTSFGMHVTFEQPGVAERSMYFGGNPFWTAGHESAGVTEPSPTWFLAEGATGPFFETFVLLANPGDQPTEATVTFLPDTGVPVVKTVPIPAQARVTLNIEAEDPSLANAAVATQVTATQPILVERAQYWPDPAPRWYEAHNSFGVTAVGTKWGLAEGRSGGSFHYQTYILLANPGTEEAHVTVTFLLEGSAPVARTYTVQPRSRFNVDTSAIPELADLYFGAVVTSDQPIAVERAMYNDANGQVWAAGTNATATPLP